MHNVKTFFSGLEDNVSHAVTSCAHSVEGAYSTVSTGYLEGRRKIVRITADHCSPKLAYIVDKMIGAVPEIFVALVSLTGGVLTMPAWAVSLGRKAFAFTPLLPTAKKFLHGEMTPNDLGEGILNSVTKFGQLFDNALVPALLVAFTVDTIYAFTVGWLAGDYALMLHGTAIAFPGAFLAGAYLWQKASHELDTSHCCTVCLGTTVLHRFDLHSAGE